MIISEGLLLTSMTSPDSTATSVPAPIAIPISDIINFLSLSKNTMKKMVQNLWWGAGYNVIAVPLAAGILASIGLILSQEELQSRYILRPTINFEPFFSSYFLKGTKN